MIQANELRCGNWVIYNNVLFPENTSIPFKVTLNTFDEIFRHVSYKGTLSGITITEEWLLSFGFIKLIEQDDDIDKWYQIEIKDGYYLEYFMSMSYISSILIEVNNVVGDNQFILPNTPKYVHELQNLYFALTQKELEINFK